MSGKGMVRYDTREWVRHGTRGLRCLLSGRSWLGGFKARRSRVQWIREIACYHLMPRCSVMLPDQTVGAAMNVQRRCWGYVKCCKLYAWELRMETREGSLGQVVGCGYRYSQERCGICSRLGMQCSACSNHSELCTEECGWASQCVCVLVMGREWSVFVYDGRVCVNQGCAE